MRDDEAVRAAILQRLSVERDTLEQEEARAAARVEDLETRIEQMQRDISREREILDEAKEALTRLEDETAKLGAVAEEDETPETDARTTAQARFEELQQAEGELSQATGEMADARAEREQIENRIEEAAARIIALEDKGTHIAEQLAGLETGSGGAPLGDLEADVAPSGGGAADSPSRFARSGIRPFRNPASRERSPRASSASQIAT